MSERLALDRDFLPLQLDPSYTQFITRINRDYRNNLRNLNLHHTSFLQNKHNVIYIVNHHIKPLYHKYELNKIQISYTIIDSSNQTKLFTTNNLNILKEFKLKHVDQFSNNQYYVKFNYVYPPNAKVILDSHYVDKPWFQTFNGTRRALRHLKDPRSMLKEYFTWCGFDGEPFLSLLDLSIQVVLPWFDKLKQYLHAHIDSLPPEIRYFFDIPTMAGFPKMGDRLMTDDPQQWLSEPSRTNVTPGWWCGMFKKTFGAAVERNPTNLFTLDEFAVRPWLWTTSGASGNSQLYIDGELVRSKFGAAVSLSSNTLLSLLEEAVRNPTHWNSKISVFIKPDEKGYKRRLIANVPLGAYIIASYVRYLVTSFTGENPIFMKLSPTFDDILDVISLLRQHELALPLDESAYDYNVTRESWLGFFAFLKDTFPSNKGVLYLERYFHTAIWEFDGKQGRWLAGMPSGLALTSFVNSWMNYIKQITLVPGHINWAAGDDVLSFPYVQQIDMTTLSLQYKAFGSVANPVKNWKSYKYAEYLKRFIGPFGTTGYPARIWSSLMYAGNERFFLPSDKLPELAELWKQFFDRLGVRFPERYVAKDLARAVSSKVSNFNVHTAIDWLHAPKIHGGFGRLPYNKLTFTWSGVSIIEGQYTGNKIRLPRAITYVGTPELNIGKYRISSPTYRTGPSYHLCPIDSYSDWEKRLNREDINYHGPFASLILDVIPLPTIDFVSTANLSQLAQQYSFNSYPNMRGTWNAIASKLINASIGLSNLVTSILNKHTILTLS